MSVNYHYRRTDGNITFESDSTGIGRMLNSDMIMRGIRPTADRIKERAELLAPVYGEDEVLRAERRRGLPMPKQVIEARKARTPDQLRRSADERKRRGSVVVPSRDKGDKHRGRYKASFKIKEQHYGGATKDRVEIIVYNDAPEAFWVEFGHRGREPEHILARAAFRPYKGMA